MNLRAILKRFTPEQLRQAIRLRSTYSRVEALEEKRAALLKQAARIDRKLSKLNGGSGSATAATTAKPERKPGRRRGYKMSAATRDKMRVAALQRYGKAKAEAPAAAA